MKKLFEISEKYKVELNKDYLDLVNIWLNTPEIKDIQKKYRSK